MSIETELLAQISRDRLWETNKTIAQWVRLSGSPAEREAVDYIKSVLEEYGLTTQLITHPALISYPLASKLEALDANGNIAHDYRCLGHAFSASVDGLVAAVVDVGNGTSADYAKQDVRGKVIVQTGLATPPAVYAAEQAGALGEIFVNDDYLHNMIVSTVWGAPTPESAKRLPKTPAVSIVESDGIDLRRSLSLAKDVRVRLTTNNFRAWQETPILIGELKGQTDDFVLFSGHQDSWHEGAMDNGSANATMLEVGRLLATVKEQLRRGLRIVFWSGHSHGRYSGSTWYADHHWEELYDHCVAHVNVDSTGARGATFYGTFLTHKELSGLGASAIKQHTGQDSQPKRMSRAGDMSFNGVGIPALFMTLSQAPVADENQSSVAASLSALLDGKMPWWWHTSEDTLDKVDLDVLTLDTKVYVSVLWRLCHEPLLPLDFRPVVADLESDLAALQEAASAHYDFTPLRQRASELAAAVDQLEKRRGRLGGAKPTRSNRQPPTDLSKLRGAQANAQFNRQLMALSRTLIPITYTLAGNFDHDPAWPIPPLPSLQIAKQLATLSPDSDTYQFTRTQLQRNVNAVMFVLRQALEAATL
jgi:hypothetical protein